MRKSAKGAKRDVIPNGEERERERVCVWKRFSQVENLVPTELIDYEYVCVCVWNAEGARQLNNKYKVIYSVSVFDARLLPVKVNAFAVSTIHGHNKKSQRQKEWRATRTFLSQTERNLPDVVPDGW